MSSNKPIRKLKFKLLMGDLDFELDDSICRKNLHIIDFIIKNVPHKFILSGSLSLKLFGLIDREINDIDLIIDDVNSDKFDYDNGSYNDDNFDNRLGYVSFKETGYFSSIFSKIPKKGYVFDFFSMTNKNRYDEYNIFGRKILISNPIEVIGHKLNMIDPGTYYLPRRKNYDDISHIFTKLKMKINDKV